MLSVLSAFYAVTYKLAERPKDRGRSRDVGALFLLLRAEHTSHAERRVGGNNNESTTVL